MKKTPLLCVTMIALSVFIVLFLLSPQAAQALMVEIAPDELAHRADLIVTGRVDNLHSYWNEEKTNIYTSVTVSIKESLKGRPVRDKITIILPGGEVDGIGQVVSDTPTFRPGEEVFLFLTALPPHTSTGKVVADHRGVFNDPLPQNVHEPAYIIYGNDQGKYAIQSGRINGEKLDIFESRIKAYLDGKAPLREFAPTLPGANDPPPLVGLPPQPMASPAGEGFVYLGIRWPGHAPQVPYRINAPAAQNAQIQAAADKWSNAGANFALRYDGTHNRVGRSALNGVNEIMFYDLGVNHILGVASIWYQYGTVIETDMVFNTRFRWSTSLPTPHGYHDVQTVALHEFGHWLVLDHSPVYGSAMYYAIKGTQRYLHAVDIAGIRYIYGEAGDDHDEDWDDDQDDGDDWDDWHDDPDDDGNDDDRDDGDDDHDDDDRDDGDDDHDDDDQDDQDDDDQDDQDDHGDDSGDDDADDDDTDDGADDNSDKDNSRFADRIVIKGVKGRTTGTNSSASREPDEPYHAGDMGGSSVWWEWTAPESGPVFFDTFGSDFDTVLAVYTGAKLANLTEVASNDNYNLSGQSKVTFNAEKGVSYKIAVDGWIGFRGNIVLNWLLDLKESGEDIFISVASEPMLGGKVEGGGIYAHGEDVTVIAEANEGYLFLHWSEQGAVVSNRAVYTFNAATNRNLQADFVRYSGLLYRQNRSGGELDVQILSGTDPVGRKSLIPAGKGVDWQAVALGDLNGNGHADIIWENIENGLRRVWLMEGLEMKLEVPLGPGMSNANFRIAAAFDMDGDGYLDIVWQNVVFGGRNVWFMQGTERLDGLRFEVANANWHIATVADLKGDGSPVIIWEHLVDERRSYWVMDHDLNRLASDDLSAASSGWRIVAAGDVNGDGAQDLILAHPDGQSKLWLMDGLNGPVQTINLAEDESARRVVGFAD